MAQRFIEENEDGFAIFFGIIGMLIYLIVIVPVLLVVDLIRSRRRRRTGRHRA